MKSRYEVILAVILLAVIFLKADPFHFLMPNEIQMILLCILAAAFALYAGLVFREKPKDERESLHLHMASRAAYMTGTITLTVLIIVQDVLHKMDITLLLVLGVMVITKLVVLVYSRSRN